MNRQEMESFLNAYSPFRNGSSNNSQSSGAAPQDNANMPLQGYPDVGLQGASAPASAPSSKYFIPDYLKKANIPGVEQEPPTPMPTGSGPHIGDAPSTGWNTGILANAAETGVAPEDVTEMSVPTEEDWNNRVLLAMQKNGGSYEGAYNAIMQEEAHIAQTMAMQAALRIGLIPNTSAFNTKVDELQQQYMMESPDYIAALSGMNDIRASRLAKDEAQKSAETQAQLTPASWLDPDVVSFNYMGY